MQTFGSPFPLHRQPIRLNSQRSSDLFKTVPWAVCRTEQKKHAIKLTMPAKLTLLVAN